MRTSMGDLLLYLMLAKDDESIATTDRTTGIWIKDTDIALARYSNIEWEMMSEWFMGFGATRPFSIITDH